MGYLHPADVERQAEAFCAWYRRRGGGSWLEAWSLWSWSKGFAPETSAAVRHAAHELLFAAGDTTDPPELAA